MIEYNHTRFQMLEVIICYCESCVSVTALCRCSLCVLLEMVTLATQPTSRLCCYKERGSTLWYVQNHCHFHIVVNSVCNRNQQLVLFLICVLD